MSNLSSPPVPKPTSPHDVLPSDSPRKPLGRVPLDVQSFQLFCPNDIRQASDSYFWPVKELAQYLDPPFPTDLYLAYSLFWRQFEPPVILPPNEKYSRTYQIQHGMSTTDQETMSAEFGISGYLLSAKLSSSLNRTITITNSTTSTRTITDDGDSSHVVVLTLWQLFEVYTVEDSRGRLSTYRGVNKLFGTSAFIYGATYSQPLELNIDRQLFPADSI